MATMVLLPEAEGVKQLRGKTCSGATSLLQRGVVEVGVARGVLGAGSGEIRTTRTTKRTMGRTILIWKSNEEAVRATRGETQMHLIKGKTELGNTLAARRSTYMYACVDLACVECWYNACLELQ